MHENIIRLPEALNSALLADSLEVVNITRYSILNGYHAETPKIHCPHTSLLKRSKGNDAPMSSNHNILWGVTICCFANLALASNGLIDSIGYFDFFLFDICGGERAS